MANGYDNGQRNAAFPEHNSIADELLRSLPTLRSLLHSLPLEGIISDAITTALGQNRNLAFPNVGFTPPYSTPGNTVLNRMDYALRTESQTAISDAINAVLTRSWDMNSLHGTLGALLHSQLENTSGFERSVQSALTYARSFNTLPNYQRVLLESERGQRYTPFTDMMLMHGVAGGLLFQPGPGGQGNNFGEYLHSVNSRLVSPRDVTRLAQSIVADFGNTDSFSAKYGSATLGDVGYVMQEYVRVNAGNFNPAQAKQHIAEMSKALADYKAIFNVDIPRLLETLNDTFGSNVLATFRNSAGTLRQHLNNMQHITQMSGLGFRQVMSMVTPATQMLTSRGEFMNRMGAMTVAETTALMVGARGGDYWGIDENRYGTMQMKHAAGAMMSPRAQMLSGAYAMWRERELAAGRLVDNQGNRLSEEQMRDAFNTALVRAAGSTSLEDLSDLNNLRKVVGGTAADFMAASRTRRAFEYRTNDAMATDMIMSEQRENAFDAQERTLKTIVDSNRALRGLNINRFMASRDYEERKKMVAKTLQQNNVDPAMVARYMGMITNQFDAIAQIRGFENNDYLMKTDVDAQIARRQRALIRIRSRLSEQLGPAGPAGFTGVMRYFGAIGRNAFTIREAAEAFFGVKGAAAESIMRSMTTTVNGQRIVDPEVLKQQRSDFEVALGTFETERDISADDVLKESVEEQLGGNLTREEQRRVNEARQTLMHGVEVVRRDKTGAAIEYRRIQDRQKRLDAMKNAMRDLYLYSTQAGRMERIKQEAMKSRVASDFADVRTGLDEMTGVAGVRKSLLINAIEDISESDDYKDVNRLDVVFLDEKNKQARYNLKDETQRHRFLQSLLKHDLTDPEIIKKLEQTKFGRDVLKEYRQEAQRNHISTQTTPLMMLLQKILNALLQIVDNIGGAKKPDEEPS